MTRLNPRQFASRSGRFTAKRAFQLTLAAAAFGPCPFALLAQGTAPATPPLATAAESETRATQLADAPAPALFGQTSPQTPQTTTSPAPAAAKLAPKTPQRSAIAAGTTSLTLPVSVSFLSRNRADAVDYYTESPYTGTYPYVEHLLRIAVAQRVGSFDWQAELSENTLFDLPTTAISPVGAQGQLFLGGTYYAANGPGNTTPSAASFKQGWLRYHGKGPDTTLRLGRFEFFEGQETTPKDPTLLWLQTNRIAQRLIGNFGFSNGQRSFDGIDGHFGRGTWDITAMAGRADQGVFNMNANPELNVDVQYLAYTKRQLKDHLLFRTFAIDYHDGRTGLTKTDNRTAAARALDHRNIRLGTYGADVIGSAPAGPGTFDGLFWGVLQNGNWGVLTQHSGAFAVEGGYRLTHVASRPWLRGGWFRSTGDKDNTDTVHNTFAQLLPTPRVYARFPFYNLQNNKDGFVQVIDSPSRRLDLRSDLHFLQLTSPADLLYNGGGAYDKKVFGFTGRTAGNHTSLATIADVSADFAVTPALSMNLYYAHSIGKTVIASIYQGNQANFGYMELIYRFGIRQRVRKAAK